METMDENSLTAWLQNSPPEFACVLAARAALRVTPLLIEALHRDAEPRRCAIVLPSFGALAATRFAGAWPTRAAEIRNAARAVAHKAGEAVSDAGDALAMNIVEATEADLEGTVYSWALEKDNRTLGVAGAAVDAAVHAVQAAIGAVDAAKGIASPEAVFNEAIAAIGTARDAVDSALGEEGDAGTDVPTHSAEFWKAVEQDVEFLETSEGETAAVADVVARLSDRALWLDTMPVWVGRRWADFKDALPEDEGWRIWTDWYEARLQGQSADETLEFARVAIPYEEWEHGPARVNTLIAERVAAQDDPLIVAITRGLEEVDAVTEVIDLSQYKNRIKGALPKDPSRAISETKNMLETTMKTILSRRGVKVSGKIAFPALTDRCLSELGLKERNSSATEGERCLRRITSSARKMIEAANELRNRAGDGHGYVVGEEPVVAPEDASLVASTGMVVAVWLLRHEKKA